MNIHVRYKELRSVGEYENAEAEASVNATCHDNLADDEIANELQALRELVFEAVRDQILAARRVHGLKIGDEVIGQDKYERRIKIWAIEEITNKYIYCVRMIDDWMDEEKEPVAERCVFKHSEVEKATPKLKELAGLS